MDKSYLLYYFKNLVRGSIFVATFNFFSSIATAYPHQYTNVYLESCHHPPREPKGLFICGFGVYNNNSDIWSNYQYRIYCPTKMVRDISNGTWGKAQKDREEDRLMFNNEIVVRSIVSQACN